MIQEDGFTRRSGEKLLSSAQESHESRLFEMVIGGQGISNVSLLHDCERDAVGETPGLVWPIDEQLVTAREQFRVDRKDKYASILLQRAKESRGGGSMRWP